MMGALRACAAALPPVAATVAMLAVALLEAGGGAPLAVRPQNVAEAAGLGNAAEVLRMLAAGADPTALLPLRPEIVSTDVRRVSAVEAAVWSRRVELVRLLDDHGTIVGAERGRLACLAQDLEARDIVEYLAAAAAPVCPEQSVRDVIVARGVGIQ